MKLKSLKYLIIMMTITLVINESYSYHILDFSGDEIHLEIETEVENEVEVEAAIETLAFITNVDILMNGYFLVNNPKTLYLGVNYPPPEL